MQDENRIFTSFSGNEYRIGCDFGSVLTGEQLSNEKNAPIRYYVVLNKGNASLEGIEVLIFAANDILALEMMELVAKRNRRTVTLFNRKTGYSLAQFEEFCQQFVKLSIDKQILLNNKRTNLGHFYALEQVHNVFKDEAIKIAQQFGIACERCA